MWNTIYRDKHGASVNLVRIDVKDLIDTIDRIVTEHMNVHKTLYKEVVINQDLYNDLITYYTVRSRISVNSPQTGIVTPALTEIQTMTGRLKVTKRKTDRMPKNLLVFTVNEGVVLDGEPEPEAPKYESKVESKYKF